LLVVTAIMFLRGIKRKFERFKSIFADHWLAFTELYPRYDTDYYHAEITKMINCGTGSGGFAIFKCLKCGQDEHVVNFSCKGKGCPHCGKRYARDSMEKIASNLFLGISYRQIVLTLPQQLRIPFYNHPNYNDLYAKFMALGQACLEEVVHVMYSNTVYKIACVVFIHTHGRNGVYNPHLHLILGEGALDPKTETWKQFSYIPMDVLRLTWQKHLLRLVSVELPKYNLVESLSTEYPDGFYANPGKKEKVPTKSYKGLIRYLTKYLASPPIGIARITDYVDDEVTYHYKSHKTKKTEYETLGAIRFIGRMVQHILPKRFQRVRYYGLQSTSSFKKWFEIIARVAGDLIDATVSYAKRIRYADFFEELVSRNPLLCRNCGHEMELWQLYHPDKGVIWDLQDRLLKGLRI
jgi:hypothetical protein